MILTHPILFNTIVILFIAFTSGWLVYVFNGKNTSRLLQRIKDLELEKEQWLSQPANYKEHPEGQWPSLETDTPVITFSDFSKANTAR